MSAFRHFYLLLWKNFVLQLRHPWVTFFEIVLPCFFIVMIAGIRIAVKVTHYENSTFYESFGIYHLPNITVPQMTMYKILYSPNNTNTPDLVMAGVKNKLDELNKQDRFSRRYDFEVQGFKSEDDLVYQYLNKAETKGVILCGVVFEKCNKTQPELSFKLRFKSSPTNQEGDGMQVRTWSTKSTFPQFSVPGPRVREHNTGGQPGYYEEGFLTIQHLVSMAFLDVTQRKPLNTGFDDYDVNGQRFPYPPYIDDGFLVALQFLFPIILMFSFMYTPCNLTKNLVLEKEKRLKESMKMMGLKEWMHWVAWFSKYLIWMAITVGIMTLLMCIKLKDGVGILNKSDPSLVFVYFMLYGINTIAFSFLVSTVFSKANVAGVGTGVIFFMTFMPYFTSAQRYL